MWSYNITSGQIYVRHATPIGSTYLTTWGSGKTVDGQPYFPRSCFINDSFEKHFTVSKKTEEHPRFGPVTFYHIDVEGVHLENVAWEFKDNKSAGEEDMKDWIGFRITKVFPYGPALDRITEVDEPGVGVNRDYGMFD